MKGFEGILADPRMWNVVDPSSPYHLSTKGIEGLKEMGVLKR
jgi:hypothetical protein